MTKRFSRPAAAVLGAALLLVACAEKPLPETGSFRLRPVTFGELCGWEQDNQAEAIPAMLRSCGAIMKKPAAAVLGAKSAAGKAGDWRPPCEALRNKPPRGNAEARRYFENWFTPYAVNGGAAGLFTGYYEAEINGAKRRRGRYQTPLWQRPKDLVTVDLGDFKPELAGWKIAGKIEGGKLIPYDDRAAIAAGSLAKRAKPLVWTDDPIAAFFLAIQGSGRVRLPDGSSMRIAYDAQNGRQYVPIGRTLADEGEIERPVTMAKIMEWLRARPDRAQATMNRNPSVIFFRRNNGEGPVGAEGVVLTPERSLAVDAAFIPLGAPLWLDLKTDDGGVTQPPPRLAVAQDTGGAIKGAVRGDLFWGAGPEAEARAGATQGRGTYFLFLPKTVKTDDAEQ